MVPNRLIGFLPKRVNAAETGNKGKIRSKSSTFEVQTKDILQANMLIAW